MLSIPPVVILVFFKQQNPLYLNLYVRYFFLYVDCKTVRIFAYSSTCEQSNRRSGMRLQTESETGERRLSFFSLASHARRACEARDLRARKTLTPRFTVFFTDFEKKTDCFAVYSVCYRISFLFFFSPS